MKALRHSLRALSALPCALLVLGRWPWFYVPYVRFERPLLALPVAIAVWFVVARLSRLSVRQHRARRLLQTLTLGGAALTAAYAVIGVELGRPLDRLAVIVAIDRSRSIDLVPGADLRVASELRVAEVGMREHDRIGTVAFGASAAVEDPLRERTVLPAPQKADIGRDGSDLGAALRRALGEVPADAAARIVIVSDGVATRGDTLSAAAAAVAAGVPVDVVPLDQAKVPDVRVASVRTAPRANAGEALDLRVVTDSTSAAQVELRVFRDGTLIRKGNAKIAAGEDVLHLREVAGEPGFHRYDVEMSAQDPKLDQAHEDNSGSAFVRVRGEAVALILERDPPLAKAMQHALEAAAFKVQVAGLSGVPSDLAAFAAYDLIVLSDLSATELAASQLEALASYVRDLGGGLLLMGGEHSLGPGGFGKTPVEDVSPVSFDLKQERRRASLAEVIAVDYSGSMAMSAGSNTKLELANEAAVRSAELLGAGDRLGVMHVDTAVQWTVPLGSVLDKTKIAHDIRAVGPGGGGIYVDLALETGYRALEKEHVQLKHLLLFSDGNDAEERTNAFALVSSGKARGITTSVVSLGKGSDVTALEHMSKLGDGRFYLIEDASRLPAVFAQETILAARSSINELSFKPALASAGPATRGIDFGAAPPLSGYVVTLPKGRAQVHLSGPEGDPILATWSAGIGRTATFTSDFSDRWGLQWTSWDGAERMFGQLARDLSRRADNPRVRVEADTLGGELRLRASVIDEHGHAENFRRIEVRVAGPDGFSTTVPLEAAGAGSYAGSLPLSRPGAYVATAVDEQTNEALGTTAAALSAGEELRPTGTDRGTLRQITRVTGGKVRDTLAGIFADRDALRFAYQSLNQWLAVLAAAGLLLGVASRRLAIPEFVGHASSAMATWLADFRRRTSPSERAEHHSAQRERLAALRKAKARSDEARAPGAPAPLEPLVILRPGPAQDRPPESTPSFSRSSRPPPPVAPGAAGDSAERKATAAEILLARRRGRKS
ncbi:MAG: VWA domain-containing protein [Myxococcales bacterium]